MGTMTSISDDYASLKIHTLKGDELDFYFGYEYDWIVKAPPNEDNDHPWGFVFKNNGETVTHWEDRNFEEASDGLFASIGKLMEGGFLVLASPLPSFRAPNPADKKENENEVKSNVL